MEAQQLTRRDVEAMIVQRAWTHPEFREEFLADPKAVIEKYSGQKLPAELNVVALAEDDKTIHFVIPAKPASADELSDQDLEKVAGGIDIVGGLVLLGLLVGGGLLGSAGAAAGTKTNHGW